MAGPKWKRDAVHRWRQERRGRRRRRDRRGAERPGLLTRLACLILGHDALAGGARRSWKVICRRCRRAVFD